LKKKDANRKGGTKNGIDKKKKQKPNRQRKRQGRRASDGGAGGRKVKTKFSENLWNDLMSGGVGTLVLFKHSKGKSARPRRSKNQGVFCSQ